MTETRFRKDTELEPVLALLQKAGRTCNAICDPGMLVAHNNKEMTSQNVHAPELESSTMEDLSQSGNPYNHTQCLAVEWKTVQPDL